MALWLFGLAPHFLSRSNIIHGSDSVESAKKEISLWFKPEELTAWKPVSNAWIYE
jgi:nucleoside-diphosphate kinase